MGRLPGNSKLLYSPRKYSQCLSGVLSSLLILFVSSAFGQSPSLEAQIKASLIFNFAQFIDWPPDSVPPAKTFNICVMGHEELATALASVESEVMKGLRVRVMQIKSNDLEAINECLVVFVGGGKEGNWVPVLERLQGKSILTVGETAAFLEKGGIITLKVKDQKLHFDINSRAAADARLVISSKLLRLADNVIT